MNNDINRNKNKGFTLIELLVVISIISLLASIVFVSLKDSRVKARDARRIEDLEQIRNALEMYYTDHGEYPPVVAGGYYIYNTAGYYYHSYDSSWDILAQYLSHYISKLPKDPINSNCDPWWNKCYSYSYGNVGHPHTNGVFSYSYYSDQYDLTANLEDPNNKLRCGLKNYKYNFGQSFWCGGYSPQIYEASPDYHVD